MYKSTKGRIAFAGLALAAMLLGGCAAVQGGGGGNAGNDEDLNLGRYDKVMIDPVTVSFADDGLPLSTGTRLHAASTEAERVRRSVAELFNDTFREELAAGPGLTVVDRPGPGVARITPELLEVRLNAPVTELGRPAEVYIRSVGEVTLNATFRDAATGEPLLVLNDTMRGRDFGVLRAANPLHTRYELKRIFQDWAQIIREDLFRAR